MARILNRRKFIGTTSFTAAGVMMGSSFAAGCSPDVHRAVEPYDIMADVMKYRKIDAHCHPEDDLAKQIETADRLGIEWLQISRPVTNFSGTEPEGPDVVRQHNDEVYKAMKAYPGRFVGFFTLNPIYRKESLEEIKRCVDLGMSGYKGYIQVKVNDPLYYPIIEKLIDLKMVVFMHTFCQMGMGGYRMKYDTGRFPGTTLPEDMVKQQKDILKQCFILPISGGAATGNMSARCLNSARIFLLTPGAATMKNI